MPSGFCVSSSTLASLGRRDSNSVGGNVLSDMVSTSGLCVKSQTCEVDRANVYIKVADILRERLANIAYKLTKISYY